jgi:hypothetical protein
MLFHAPLVRGAEQRLLLMIGGQTWCLRASKWVAETSAPDVTFSAAVSGPHNISIIFGGATHSGELSNSLWSFGGYRWGEHLDSPEQRPVRRHSHALGSRGPERPFLLFGGCANEDCSSTLEDTWEYDWTLGWHELWPATGPSARCGHSMTYAAARDEVVLYGGWSGTSSEQKYLGDTWIYLGDSWRELSQLGGPPPRTAHKMVTDEGSGSIVLFGGYPGDGMYLNDTWERVGDTWLRVATEHAPSPRGNFAMAYDRLRRAVVLFGGCDATQCLSDTWLYARNSGWPEEDCAAEGDEDDDGLANCADPDCAAQSCAAGWCREGICQRP